MTHRLDASRREHVIRAARLLQEGKLVAFPTETVYGLGANALSAEAVAAIFTAKKRPSWDPLIVHVAQAEDRAKVAHVPAMWSARVSQLAQAFWPGPLTLLLPRTAEIPDVVTAGRDSVGVRVPAHPVAQELLRAAVVPIAAPSANLFGHVSPTTAEHVLADLDDRIDAVLDAGPCRVGLESTVLDPLRTPMLVYRQGAVTPPMLHEVAGVAAEVYQPAALDVLLAGPHQALPSPGVAMRHYAPNARLLLVEGTPEAVWECASRSEPAAETGVLWPEDWTIPQSVSGKAVGFLLQPWGSWADARSRAAGLYAGLRALDTRGAKVIVCPLPPPGGLDDATRERLEKAARTA